MDEREKIYQELVEEYNEENGIYDLSPRLGKTRIGIGFIKKMKYNKILWVTPNTKLVEEDLPEEFSKWKAKRFIKKTTFVTYSSLYKITGKFDLIVLDETQHVTENNTANFFNGKLKGKTIIGLTGSPSKDKDKKELCRRLGLKVIKKVSIDDAVEKDIIADYQINVVECNLNGTDKEVEAGKKGSKFMQTELAYYNYVNQSVNRIMFNRNVNPKTKQFMILNRRRAIMNSPTKHKIAKALFDTLGKRVLMFASSIKQAEELSDHTYHSKTDNKDMDAFVDGSINKLSCVNAGGTGFTYRDVDHFIVVQATSDKNGDTTQKLARSLLKQGNYKAQIWIICLMGTQDETWVGKALENFDSTKIVYHHAKNLNL